MTWSASLLLILLAGAPAGASPDAASFEADVAARVAAYWSLDPVDLCIEWDPAPPAPGTPPAARVRAGRTDGAFVAEYGAGMKARFRAGVVDTTWLAARPLAAGTILAGGDLRPVAAFRPGRPATQRAPAPRPGWEIRRAVAEGERLAWPVASPVLAVAGGEEVRFAWVAGDVRVEIVGTALNSARVGETVRGRVAGRAEPLSGVAASRGVALLNPGGTR